MDWVAAWERSPAACCSGVFEAMTAGYISSAYKDAVSFVLILLVLFAMPRGLFGARAVERV